MAPDFPAPPFLPLDLVCLKSYVHIVLNLILVFLLVSGPQPDPAEAPNLDSVVCVPQRVHKENNLELTQTQTYPLLCMDNYKMDMQCSPHSLHKHGRSQGKQR